MDVSVEWMMLFITLNFEQQLLRVIVQILRNIKRDNKVLIELLENVIM
jgi:hypothetical protein